MVLVIFFIIHYVVLLVLIAGWRRPFKPMLKPGIPPVSLTITVIVPFRNEAGNLRQIIADLRLQQFAWRPEQTFEIILCNDHSSDHSVTEALEATAGQAVFRIIHSPGAGKKQALNYAVENSSGDIIVTTDADCRLPQTWLAGMLASFEDPGIKMIFGGVRIQANETFFSRIQAIEFASLIGTGAATQNFGVSTMCNGANLSFRRSAFAEVKGYEGNFDIASGDDEFLMRKVSGRYPGSVRFLSDPATVVTTKAQQSVRAFVQQRLRWAGKWRFNSSIPAKLLAVFVLFFQCAFLLLPVFVLNSVVSLPTVLFLIAFKFALEYFFISQVCLFLDLKWRWVDFLALQILYAPYVLAIGVTTQFSSFTWKDRTWRHKK